jgi:6-phosphogluconolactonase
MQESDQMLGGSSYVQTNEPENRIVAFRRESDGALAMSGDYRTGGAGDGVPHLTSQGSVTLTSDGRHVLATNAASDDLSVFAIRDDGLEMIQRVSTGGGAPKSVTEHDGRVYVLNTGKPSVTGFRIGDGGLDPIPGSEQPLSAANADPAQVGFTPDGRTLVATERGTDSIVTYEVNMDGTLGMPQAHPSSGPTPYGFAFTRSGVLVVTEAFRAEKGAAAASSYMILKGAIKVVTPSAGNGRSEICWAVVKDGRFVFTTNFADSTVSRYAVSSDGALILEEADAGIARQGSPGLRDEALTLDGRFLYAIDADAGSIVGWSVDEEGLLAPIGSWGGLPTTIAGRAAR